MSLLLKLFEILTALNIVRHGVLGHSIDDKKFEYEPKSYFDVPVETEFDQLKVC